MREVLIGVLIASAVTFRVSAQAPHWPQFRGPEGTGVATGPLPPVEFGPEKALLWTTELPAGHSSPAIWGDRIFVTAGDKASRELHVLCLDRSTGKTLWRRTVTAETIERLHDIGSPAQGTPAVDGERVYAYFGSYGLIAFDLDGNQKWMLPLPPANTSFGHGTSPVVAGDAVILSRDEAQQGYLLAVNRRTGETLWKQPYVLPNGPGAAGAATPVVWKDEIIVHRSPELVAFDRKDGSRKWWVAIRSSGTSTPVVAGDIAYVGTWFAQGEPDLRVELPDFATLVKQFDKDGDGLLSPEEFPPMIQIAQRPDVSVAGAHITFPGAAIAQRNDHNKDGKIEKAEWDVFLARRAGVDHGLLAVKLGGQGDVTMTNVLWREPRAVPEVPAPLASSTRVYMVAHGGIVSCMEAASGKLLFRKRLGGGGAYYASPVMAGSNVYFTSGDGVISVIRDADEFTPVAQSDLGQPIFATPAIVDGTVYLRTATRMYAFSQQRQRRETMK